VFQRYGPGDATTADKIALALANRQFTPQLKRALFSAVSARQEELVTLSTALDAEETSLRTAINTVEQVTDWLVTTNETPLSTLGFEALRQRHDTLGTHREQCEETLDATTSRNGSVSVAHRSVVTTLYDEFPIPYPVVGTLLCLVECCTACQRTVRAHLVRRA
jgi:hypothetical protein